MLVLDQQGKQQEHKLQLELCPRLEDMYLLLVQWHNPLFN